MNKNKNKNKLPGIDELAFGRTRSEVGIFPCGSYPNLAMASFNCVESSSRSNVGGIGSGL